MAKQAVDFVTSGTYQRALIAEGATQMTTNSEYEITTVSTSIAGSATEDTMYSWIRGKLHIINTVAEHVGYEWFLIKCQSTDAVQDLSDSAVVERLQREHRIFGRDISMAGMSRSGIKPITFELFQVKLILGEELRLVIRPTISAAGNTCWAIGLLEWRQVGV